MINRITPIIIILVTFSLANASPAPPDFSGYYFIKGTVPEFREIKWFDLIRGTDTSGKWLLSGGVRLSKQIEDKWVELKINTYSLEGQYIVFETLVVNGVSYRFNGAFLITDFSQAESGEPAVLSGMLEKLHNGKVTIKKSVELTFYAGD